MSIRPECNRNRKVKAWRELLLRGDPLWPRVVHSPLGLPGLLRPLRGVLEVSGGQRHLRVWGLEDAFLVLAVVRGTRCTLWPQALSTPRAARALAS